MDDRAIPLDTEETKVAVLFLCSDSASAITGTTLTVAGGEL